jgi:hypothetical protein
MEGSPGLGKYFDGKLIVSITVGIALFVILFLIYNHFTEKKSESSAFLTAEEYGKLNETDKAKWKLNSATGRYVPA